MKRFCITPAMRTIRVTRSLLPAILLLLLAAATPLSATPMFWVMPGQDLNLDHGWQAAAGTFYEIDFDSYANGSYVSSFSLGGQSGVTVSPSLPGAPQNTGAEIFYGDWGPNPTYGNVYEGALLTRNASGWDRVLRLDFSQPVYGFGMWIFDNGTGTVDSFQMTVNGQTSGILDANPGQGYHVIEGFLGVLDPAGITTATISNTNPAGSVFEIDHFQMAPVPEPATFGLMGLGAGLICAGGLLRRRRRRS